MEEQEKPQVTENQETRQEIEMENEISETQETQEPSETETQENQRTEESTENQETPLNDAALAFSQKQRKKKRNIWIAVVALALCVCVILPNFLLYNKMNEVIKADPRNSGISVFPHYQYFVNYSVLEYDLRQVDYNKAPADVFRVFLQYSEKMCDKNFDQVVLAYKGKDKFILSGKDFNQVGREYGLQNPIYTIRTFPAKLKTPDGRTPYPGYTGGILGVLKGEMEDFTEFHKEWYIRDM